MEAPKQTLTPTKVANNTKGNNKKIKETENRELSFHPVRHVVEITTPQRNATLEQMQQTERRHGIDDRKDRTKVNRIMLETTQTASSKLQPKF